MACVRSSISATKLINNRYLQKSFASSVPSVSKIHKANLFQNPYIQKNSISIQRQINQKRTFATTTFRSRPQEDIPSTMKCILIKDGKGPSDNLYMGEEKTPEPGKGEVLVKVKAFGLNRMDILQREGKYPLPPQASKTILGVEFSGTIDKLGEGSKLWKEGDEVYGLAYGGAYAEYIVNPETMLLPKPKELSWVETAGIPEVWMTATQALMVETPLKEGQNVLIHAGASGVGIAAIQIALHVLKAGKVFTTCGSDEKVEFLKQLGHSDKLHVINYKTQDFAEEIKKTNSGVDLIIDFIGKQYWNQNISSLNLDGKMLYLAFMSGPNFPDEKGSANLAQILGKRLTIKGSTLRSRSSEYQHNLLEIFKKNVLPKILEGELKIKIHKTYPWTDIKQAHNDMEGNKNSGKIVLEIPE